MSFFAKFKTKILGKKEKSLVEKYEFGLKKVSKNFSEKFKLLLARNQKIDHDFFEKLEEILILSDFSPSLAKQIKQTIIDFVKINKLVEKSEILNLVLEKLVQIYDQKKDLDLELKTKKIFLVVGINGSGKTTSIAKIAHKFSLQNKKILVVAADTFRAAALEQLNLWAKKLKFDLISPLQNERDPASLVYRSLDIFETQNYDLLIIDTAGRLHNNKNLMQELKKINSVIVKKTNKNPDETLLVLDATTGQNGISQAKLFAEFVHLSGIILTKMDGISKGGIVFSIKEILGLEVKFIGLGEKENDLENFEIEKFVYGITKDLT